METIRGAVGKVIFHNQGTGFKVLKIKMSEGPYATVTGEFGPEMVSGTIADFHGDYKTHAKYGTSFKAASYTIFHNAEELASIRLFIDAIAPNIGPERADMIVAYFGKDVISILDNNPERLCEVKGIGEISAESLSKAWRENRTKWEESREEYSLRAFLNSLGIKERRVKKIINSLGGNFQAELTIRNNPYILTQIEGFGFSTADFIARKLGVPEESPQRLKAFLYYALNVICPSSGHLFLTVTELLERIQEYCTDTGTKFLGVSILEVEKVQEQIDLLVNEKLVAQDNESIYSNICLMHEQQSAVLLSNIMETPSDLIFITKDYVDDHIAIFERESGFTLSDEQRKALHYFIEYKVFIITGAPGTGKTAILRAIVDLIKKLKLNLTCMTPTGISAKKLAVTIEYEASTIHRQLGFRGNEWVYGQDNKYWTDVVVIDETSMVEQDTFYHLLSALNNRVHIIFVGDDNQLPSVGAGNVLKELINCQQIPTVRLEQIFRQEEASDIIKVAHKIKNGDTDLSLFKSDPKADVFFIRENDVSVLESYIIKIVQKFKDEKRSFQIITPRNEGPLSVKVLNELLQGVLNPPAENLEEMKCFDFILRKGDRIKVKKNDYENLIFNGDIGKVTSISGGYVSILIDERIIQLTLDEVEEKIKLAYTVSVHSFQGLEYPIIILPFIRQFGRMLLQRNLLYTAITRAKEKVIVLGHGSALEQAINNASVSKRNTRLGERIEKCLQMKRNGSSSTQLMEPENYPDASQNMELSSPEEVESCPTDITAD